MRDIPVGLDPSVTGLAGRVGERVGTADGNGAWVKFGPAVTDWRADPGEPGGGDLQAMLDDVGGGPALLKYGADGTPVAAVAGVDYDVPRAVHITTLGAASATLTVAGLDADAEGDYDVEGELFIAVNNSQPQWQPNGLATNLIGASTDFAVGAAADTNGGTLWILARNSGIMNFQSGQKVYFSGRFHAQTGRIRKIVLDCIATGGANAFASGFSRDQFTLRGVWTDTATNLTSLAIAAGQTDGFGIGSYMKLVARGALS